MILAYFTWVYLIGGLEHEFYCSIQLGMSSSQLTFIFFRGVETTNQLPIENGDFPWQLLSETKCRGLNLKLALIELILGDAWAFSLFLG